MDVQEKASVHELGIARDICVAAAREVRGRRITSMTVEVGALAGVSCDALDFCMTQVAIETGLGEPVVTIRESPAVFRCACGREYEAADITAPCPSCGGYERDLVSGADIVIREIEYEDGTQ